MRPTKWQRDLSISRDNLGDLAVAAGDLAGAGEQYRASLGIAERLAGADPTNTEWQRDLSIKRERLIDLTENGRSVDAGVRAHETSSS